MSQGEPSRRGDVADDPRPQPPVAPEALDCCGEGCVRCIYDHYDEALTAYREALSAWLERHPGAPAASPDD